MIRRLHGHDAYSSRGDEDPSNLGGELDRVIRSYAQQSDGAMVCWKAIALSA